MPIIDFELPIRGKHEGFATENQLPLSSGNLNNVRPKDVLEGKIRIGQRPGLDKWGDGDQIGAAEEPVVAICFVSSIE